MYFRFGIDRLKSWQRQEKSILKLISSITQRLKNVGQALILFRNCFTKPLEDFIPYDEIIDVLDLPANVLCYPTDYSLDVRDWTRINNNSKRHEDEEEEEEEISYELTTTRKTTDELKLMGLEMLKVMRAAQIVEMQMTKRSYQPSKRQIEVFYEIFSYISDTAKELIDLFINAIED